MYAVRVVWFLFACSATENSIVCRIPTARRECFSKIKPTRKRKDLVSIERAGGYFFTGSEIPRTSKMVGR